MGNDAMEVTSGTGGCGISPKKNQNDKNEEAAGNSNNNNNNKVERRRRKRKSERKNPRKSIKAAVRSLVDLSTSDAVCVCVPIPTGPNRRSG
jgi:hypothetical protein